ncbi:MAG: hypothetical protein IPK60_09900 [Sandaracinaceae bacterium]|nr:hypothetical protein [Sandaracinaceae bacterium]
MAKTKSKARPKAMAGCDPLAVGKADYSKLDATFAKLAKPAQRALLNSKIHKPKDLAKWSLKDLAALHGVGPSALATLKRLRSEK